MQRNFSAFQISQTIVKQAVQRYLKILPLEKTFVLGFAYGGKPTHLLGALNLFNPTVEEIIVR